MTSKRTHPRPSPVILSGALLPTSVILSKPRSGAPKDPYSKMRILRLPPVAQNDKQKNAPQFVIVNYIFLRYFRYSAGESFPNSSMV